MKEPSVLEEQNTSGFRQNIQFLLHVVRVERRCTSSELGPSCCFPFFRWKEIETGFVRWAVIVEVQMEGEVGSFVFIRRLVAAVTVRFVPSEIAHVHTT